MYVRMMYVSPMYVCVCMCVWCMYHVCMYHLCMYVTRQSSFYSEYKFRKLLTYIYYPWLCLMAPPLRDPHRDFSVGQHYKVATCAHCHKSVSILISPWMLLGCKRNKHANYNHACRKFLTHSSCYASPQTLFPAHPPPDDICCEWETWELMHYTPNNKHQHKTTAKWNEYQI